MLEQAEVSHYLLALGLVKARAVIEEDLAIVNASRRNCVFLALTHAGPTYVIKQAAPQNAPTLAHEAAVLRVLESAPELEGHLPTVVHHDARAGRLILRTAGGARDWGVHFGGGRFARLPVRALGRALAALHRLPVHSVEPLPPGFDRMWGLSLPEPPHELVLDLSSGAQDLVARLQASRATCDRLDELRDACSDDGVVHGDLRWDNCLAVAAPGSRRRTRVLLVDWELAGPGAAGFDVGTVLSEYLRLWVGSIPIVDPSDPGRLVNCAGHPLRRMQPAVQAFWAAYRRSASDRPTLRRVIELAAVHLLQTAVERAQSLTQASAHVLTLVQLADNMLRRPEEAALNLLSLRE
jgi:Ser/Thr protein kinase RdoA (MazF antagonist)